MRRVSLVSERNLLLRSHFLYVIAKGEGGWLSFTVLGQNAEKTICGIRVRDGTGAGLLRL